MRISDLTPAQWSEALAQMGAVVGSAGSLEEAASALARMMCEKFPESVVMARVYAVVRHGDLDAPARSFVNRSVTGSGHEDELQAATPVLTLLGTHGIKSDWCDRLLSRGHLGVPLLSAAFVQGIPMVARLLKELGVGLNWLDEAPSVNARRLLGGFNGLFYVEDASSALDPQGRLIIPAQDFVRSCGVNSVFGMGGVYPGNTLVTIIVFCRESLPRERVEPMKTLVSVFKGETVRLVLAGKIFRHQTAA